MYIGLELHNAICNACIWGIGLTMGGMLLLCVLMWMPEKTRFFRRRAKIEAQYIIKRMKMCVRYYFELAQIRRDARRYKAAMKVFDKPVRWCETPSHRLR